MRTLDRYIARQFAFNFFMLFMVLCGLYFLLDLIVNFDEFMQTADRLEDAGIAERIAVTVMRTLDFYWPRIFLLYVYMAGLLPIGAAGFTLAALIRNRELLAMLAGGVSLYRIAVPIIVLTFAANMLLMANQELILPHLATRLSEGHHRLTKDHRRMSIQFAPDGYGSLFTARAFDPDHETLVDVTILIRSEVAPDTGIFDRHEQWVTAPQAVWNAQQQQWDLIDAHVIRLLPGDDPAGSQIHARNVEQITAIKSDLDPTTILLRERERYKQLLSLRQLSQLSHKPRLVDTAELTRIGHSRFSLVIVNVLILLMGLPYYLLRAPAPLLIATIKAAVVCVPAWAGGFIMHQISAGALPPATVAWLPVAIYLPIAFYMMDRVET